MLASLCVSLGIPLEMAPPVFSVFRYYRSNVIIPQVQSACSAVFQAKLATCRICTNRAHWCGITQVSGGSLLPLTSCSLFALHFLSVLYTNVTFSFQGEHMPETERNIALRMCVSHRK